MPRHTAEEYQAAREIYNEIMARDGRVTSQGLTAELSKRTGRDPKYWNVIELWTAIKSADTKAPEYRRAYTITAEHEALILEAAEIIASRQQFPQVTPGDIRQYFKQLGDKNKRGNAAAITHAKSEDINRILKDAGYTQYKIGNYTASIPPARNDTEMATAALRILEAAEDPESGMAKRLHDIRYRHKYRGKTAEEIMAAMLNDFMQMKGFDRESERFNRTAAAAYTRKHRRTLRKYGTNETPATDAMKAARHQAFRDLRAAREAAGKEPGPMEWALTFINSTPDENEADRMKAKEKQTKDQPTEDKTE